MTLSIKSTKTGSDFGFLRFLEIVGFASVVPELEPAEWVEESSDRGSASVSPSSSSICVFFYAFNSLRAVNCDWRPSRGFGT